MKIVFTGGGSGGHFYPIIAVAEELNRLIDQEKLIGVNLYYFSNDPFDKRLLFENGISFEKVEAGKLRRYFSIWNLFDLFKVLFGVLRAIWKVYRLYPDVIFSKGGYASFPTIVAARLLAIPVVIHESDSVPGRTNIWASKFAIRVAISFAEAAKYFPQEKVAVTGVPIRKALLSTISFGAKEYLKLSADLPLILILGGSQGSQNINDIVLEILPQLVQKYQIIHQTGKNNFEDVKDRSQVILNKVPEKDRYKCYDLLNEAALRMSAGISTLVISRAGSTIFEIAQWGVPSILVPLASSSEDHQRKNAFAYARTGAAQVLEENNLAPHILFSEIERLMENKEMQEEMRRKAKAFAKPEAAKKIAREIINIALKHEIA